MSNNLVTLPNPFAQLTKINYEYIWGEIQKKIFSRVEGQIHIIFYFEVTYLRTNIPTTHGLEYFGKEFTRFYDDNWKFVVAYASQSNNKTKAKYNSYERECLTIVWAMSLIWCYCYGSPFTLVTIQVLDGIRSTHRNWIFKLTRWALILQ